MSKPRFILVDGYNVINAWRELKELSSDSLEDARDKLIDMVSNYAAFKGDKVVVVFDAHMVKLSAEKHEEFSNIEVVYTKEGETADCYIERNIAELSKRWVPAVVTADYLEQRIVLQMGGIRITPNEFLIELNAAKNKIGEKINVSFKDSKNLLESNLDKKILAKLEKIRRNL